MQLVLALLAMMVYIWLRFEWQFGLGAVLALAHDVLLTAARELRYDRFLFVAVDQRKAGPSGCSIDALFRQTKAWEQEIGIELVNYAPVVFRQGSAIERVPRHQFTKLAAAGKVSLETMVFDNTLICVGDIRAGRWETPLANAWHARAFF